MKVQYDLELDRIISEAKKINAKTIVLHMPDGLKSKAIELSREIEEKTGALVFVWSNSNFGACDIPQLPKEYDLMVTFGHSTFLSKK